MKSIVDTLEISSEDREWLQKITKLFRRPKAPIEIFYDLCFCICAPQTTYKNNMTAVQELVDLGYYDNDVPLEKLETICKKVRFKKKAIYLQKIKKQFPEILEKLNSNEGESSKREWLVENVKGLGYKTASHLLRNLGAMNLAIIDTHILKFMEKKTPSNKKAYLNLEKKFKEIANQYQLSPSELDSFIWKIYSNTPWEKFIY